MFRQIGAKLGRTPALQYRAWAPGLKDGREVSQPILHHPILVVTSRGDEGNVLVSQICTVCATQVQLHEDVRMV